MHAAVRLTDHGSMDRVRLCDENAGVAAGPAEVVRAVQAVLGADQIGAVLILRQGERLVGDRRGDRGRQLRQAGIDDDVAAGVQGIRQIVPVRVVRALRGDIVGAGVVHGGIIGAAVRAVVIHVGVRGGGDHRAADGAVLLVRAVAEV